MSLPTIPLRSLDYAEVYEPAEDTYLFVDALIADQERLRRLRPRVVLELGPGSGCVLAQAFLTLGPELTQGCAFLGWDVNPAAAAATQRTAAANGFHADVVIGDLFSAWASRWRGQVDLLLFNPPYVPTPSEEVGGGDISAAWAGGLRGREVLDRLLQDHAVEELLAPGGLFYLVAVQENDPRDIRRLLKQRGLLGTTALRRRAFNEQLSILRFQKPAAAADAPR